MHNFRKVGCAAECCGICVFNQFDAYNDICENSVCEEIEEDHVCDLFEIQPDSMRLCDLKAGDVIEYDMDEPYRGNAYAGPYDVIEVGTNGFGYSASQGGNKFVAWKFAPLRGYKIAK